MKNAHLIDISAVFFRYYFAPSPAIINDKGFDIAALLFSLRWLCKPEFFKDNITVACFDESLGSGFRHGLDKDYKSNRALPSEDIIYQLMALKVFCQYLGFAVLASKEVEADDLIGAAAVKLKQYFCTIHSRDKDLRQLLNTHVQMQDVMTDNIWNENSLLEETQLMPNQVALYLALMGDNSDNIIGLPGIGDKTARALLVEYKTWEGIKAAVASGEKLPIRGSMRICNTIEEYQHLVDHNLQLTQLKTDVTVDLSSLPFNQKNFAMIEVLAHQFGIHSKLKKALSIANENIA
jgi:5'-3' exonuclease